MLAQYSIPFCVALALVREARDPESYDESALADPAIRALCRKVKLVEEAGDGHGAAGSHVTLTLNDGRKFEQHENRRHAAAGRAARQIRPPDAPKPPPAWAAWPASTSG